MYKGYICRRCGKIWDIYNLNKSYIENENYCECGEQFTIEIIKSEVRFENVLFNNRVKDK